MYETIDILDIIEEDPLCLFYYPDDNTFVDSNGFTVLDFFRYVTPNYLMIFLAHKESMIVPRRDIPSKPLVIFYDDNDENMEFIKSYF